MSIRIGNGFDVHRFADDASRPLVLGGVLLEGEIGLEGHSDADVIAHAVAESLLGAAGLDDIGTLFPDTDERWRGADSIDLLAECVARVRAAGWVPLNVDCSVIAERPKLAPHKAAMQARLGDVVGAPVTIKGRRAEQIGGLGRAEGIACLASALVESSPTGSTGDAP